MKIKCSLLHWTQSICIILTYLVLSIFSESIHASSIVANFTDGTGTSFSDQYPGVAGNGWLTAWTIVNGGTGPSSNASIANTSPLASGSGNYLSYSGGSSSTTGNAYIGVVRQHDTSVVNLAQPLTYAFDYRVDYAASVDAQYSILSSTTADSATNGNNTWIISSTLTGGWQVRGLAVSNLSVITGNTYRFVINVDPSSMSYTVSITNLNTLDSYTSATAAFRNQVTSDGSYLCFVIKDEQKLSSDTFGFSIDNLSITSIPELPSSAYILIFGTVSCLAIRFIKKYRIPLLS